MSTLNFNIGILGHVDSGKTSLAKALSTVASTASFDKNPQSRDRGITLDLGFSSFSIPIPPHLVSSGFDQVQFTLVDCPGHAQLIRTIIGGAQIIDMMLLVVDATKGMQTQTAECLVIGEITCPHLIVVLNKVDLLTESTRTAQLDKLKRKFSRTLEQTQFAGASIVPVAAQPDSTNSATTPIGVDELVKVLSDHLFIPVREPNGPFLLSVDHCFSIRGQGTIMTGTVLSGSVSVNEMVEIPELKISKKIKSMQMFHKPVQRITQGDRVGICVTQFDPSLVERCLISSPGYLTTIYAAVIQVFKIPYYKSECKSGGKFHVTIGHETIMAKATFFSSTRAMELPGDFALHHEYLYHDSLLESSPIQVAATQSIPEAVSGHQFALLEFEKPLVCPPHSKIIGSRLDNDAFSNACRIAFHGMLVKSITQKDYGTSVLPQIRIFKPKRKEGLVDRIQDERTIIGKSLFKKETKIELFVTMKVQLSTGECGVIEGTFGTSGKFRVNFPGGLLPGTIQLLSKKKQKGAGSLPENAEEATTNTVKIILNFKRFIFDPCKRMIQ